MFPSPIRLASMVKSNIRQYSTSSFKAMEQRIKVATLDQLPIGKHCAFNFQGEGDEALQILLSNVGGNIRATSSKCTHFGLPLEKGILRGDGRLVCFAHGACFDSKTGDIEDSPALESLLSFKCEVVNKEIFVTADPERLKGKPGVGGSCKGGLEAIEKKGKGSVVVGGGPAAVYLVESARKNGYLGPLTIISSEPHAPIDRTKLSKALVSDPKEVQWRSRSHLSKVLGVTLRDKTTVKSIDVKSKSLTLEGGEKVEYENVILATGGTPKRLPLEGKELENILVMRGLSDTAALNKALGEKKDQRVVVIGTSFIGLEAAGAAAEKSKRVVAVGMEAVPLMNILGKEVGAGLQKSLEKNGIKFYLEAGVKSFKPSESDSKSVGGVVIQNKNGNEETLEADIVLLGVGVAPATNFLEDAKGFPELRKDGGVEVDDRLRVVGLPTESGVFAIGDIAAYPSRQDGTPVRIEHYNVSTNHARAIGELLGTGKEEPFTKLPIFWSALGSQLRYVADGGQPGFETCYVDGSLDELKFAAYYAKGDTVVAVGTMGVDPLMVQCSELMRLGKLPLLSKIKSGNASKLFKELLEKEHQAKSKANL